MTEAISGSIRNHVPVADFGRVAVILRFVQWFDYDGAQAVFIAWASGRVTRFEFDSPEDAERAYGILVRKLYGTEA